jgi:OOP family OmpA-OmpF porin
MTHRYTVAALLLAGWAQAQEMELQVELLNRVGTDTSRRGDPVSARIVAPDALRGSVVEGRVAESTSGARTRGQSVLSLEFDVLRHAGTVTPIRSRIASALNSNGQTSVDGGGRVILRAPAPKPSSGTSGMGRALGGIAGGKGPRIGGAVDQAASAPSSQGAPDLRFETGSRFTLRTSTRSGPPLASVAAGQPAASAPPPRGTTEPAPVSVYQPPLTAAAAPAPQASSAPAAAPGQPDLVAVKAEFVPGDKAFFFDDLTDMTGEDAPPHWKVRGGTAELRKAEDVRQLTVNSRRVTLTPNLTGFPKNFTMESVMRMNGHGAGLYWIFKDKAAKEGLRMRLEANYTRMIIQAKAGAESLTDQQIVMDWKKPIKVQLWLQNGRLRLYINDVRVFDVNQINVGELASVEADIYMNQSAGQTEKYVGLQGVRFAESVPDLSQVLTSSGRYIVRGILFDTDSDRIKPESAAAIKKIANTLEANAALKLLIEGHTDSVGDAAHNMDLSKRRAEAVKAVLVEQFKVDAARLSAAGMGATKPVEPNDTPKGRAENRRVELVKL